MYEKCLRGFPPPCWHVLQDNLLISYSLPIGGKREERDGGRERASQTQTLIKDDIQIPMWCSAKNVVYHTRVLVACTFLPLLQPTTMNGSVVTWNWPYLIIFSTGFQRQRQEWHFFPFELHHYWITNSTVDVFGLMNFNKLIEREMERKYISPPSFIGLHSIISYFALCGPVDVTRRYSNKPCLHYWNPVVRRPLREDLYGLNQGQGTFPLWWHFLFSYSSWTQHRHLLS